MDTFITVVLAAVIVQANLVPRLECTPDECPRLNQSGREEQVGRGCTWSCRAHPPCCLPRRRAHPPCHRRPRRPRPPLIDVLRPSRHHPRPYTERSPQRILALKILIIPFHLSYADASGLRVVRRRVPSPPISSLCPSSPCPHDLVFVPLLVLKLNSRP